MNRSVFFSAISRPGDIERARGRGVLTAAPLIIRLTIIFNDSAALGPDILVTRGPTGGPGRGLFLVYSKVGLDG